MKKSASIIFLILIFSLQGFPQKEQKHFLVLSYNVENLFDTVNNPLTDDDAFTPGGEKAWTYERYKDKLGSLAKVISSLPDKELPALLGLLEVENRQVLEDLAGTRGLRKAKYRIIHEDGDDPRGIENALLYRPELFKYEGHEYIGIEDPVEPEYLYRGILHVWGEAPDGGPLHVYVNHWKSRSGGQKETERMRMYTAITLRKALDKGLARESDFRAIIMGDFNDEPTNRSILNGLSSSGKRKNVEMGEYYNLFYDAHNNEDRGTYKYRGNWNMLDQIIVSYNLVNRENRMRTGFDGGKIHSQEWMLYHSERYNEMLPSATYGGPNYYGGPSDHLPVYVVFTF